MRTIQIKILGVFLAVLFVAAPALAVEQNFGAGSLVIPMDSFYQDNGDGGMLEAYGLIFALLSHKDGSGNNDITVYWVIDDTKTSIDQTDFVVEDLTLDQAAGEVVTRVYDHNNGSSALAFNTAAGDSFNHIEYLGGPFIIDSTEAAIAKQVINDAGWAAVNIHEMQVPFKAPVFREMRGTPPKIALMDNDETGSGNAVKILEPYLRLAGICKDVYEVLTPNNIRDGALQVDPNDPSKGYKYDFLWAPHWAGYEKAPYNTDANSNGIIDADEITQKVREYLEDGNGLLAECASIEVFEHSPNGRFLTTNGLAHDGGWNDTDIANGGHIIYNDVSTPNAQIADFAYAAEGGHIHNWKPYYFDSAGSKAASGKTIEYMNKTAATYDPPRPQDSGWVGTKVTAATPSVYNDTVTRFTIDTDGWDYYVGGYIDGNTDEGYVVYLGGHSYADCGKGGKGDKGGGLKGGGKAAEPSHEIKMEFSKNIDPKLDFWVNFHYDNGTSSGWTGDIMLLNDGKIASSTTYNDGTDDILKIDLAKGPANKKDNKIEKVYYENLFGAELTIDQIIVTWQKHGGAAWGEKFVKHEDKAAGDKNYDGPGVASGSTITLDPNVVLALNPDAATSESGTATDSCTSNSDCSPKNVAGVRYILNTLFNIKYQLVNKEYVRSAPIAYTDPDGNHYMFQGTFDYPSYTGHFRKIDLSASDLNDPAATKWDVGDPTQGHIKEARDGNCLSDGATPPDCQLDTVTNEIVRDPNARQVFTASNAGGSWDFLAFDKFHVNYLRAGLNVTPTNGDDADEIAVIERLRGKIWDATNSVWIENPGNRMGGIMHSAPAITGNSDQLGRIYDSNHNGYDDRRGVFYDFNHDGVDDFTGITGLSGKSGAWVDVDGDGSDDILETRQIRTHSDVTQVDVDGDGTWDYYRLPKVAYVGDVRGMLHAIDVDSGDELWAFIPPNLLGKLKNDRTDPNAVADFAAVDASVSVQAVYYDHDGDGLKEWRNIITCAEGNGGTSIFAVDVTDPEYPEFLWEKTDNTGSGMGFGSKTAMGKVAEPVYVKDGNGNIVYYAKDSSGNAIVDSSDGYILYSLNGGSYSYYVWKDGDGDGTLELVSHSAPSGFDPGQEKKGLVRDYEIRYYVYVATGYRNYVNSHGGVNVYAFDLFTGDKIWQFSQEYFDSVNDIPGAVTLVDNDRDTFIDQAYVGDMNGRMWELDAVTGVNPHGVDNNVVIGGNTVTMNIPLFNAGTGKPISVSPAIVYLNGEQVVVFGTGGADWADPSGTYSVYMVSASRLNDPSYYDPGAGILMWKYDLEAGYKVWSTPRIIAGNVYVASATGTMESDDPKMDVAGSGKITGIYGSGSLAGQKFSEDDTGKIRSTIEVDNTSGQIIGVSNDNKITSLAPVGGGAPVQTDVILKSWRTK